MKLSGRANVGLMLDSQAMMGKMCQHQHKVLCRKCDRGWRCWSFGRAKNA